MVVQENITELGEAGRNCVPMDIDGITPLINDVNVAVTVTAAPAVVTASFKINGNCVTCEPSK